MGNTADRCGSLQVLKLCFRIRPELLTMRLALRQGPERGTTVVRYAAKVPLATLPLGDIHRASSNGVRLAELADARNNSTHMRQLMVN